MQTIKNYKIFFESILNKSKENASNLIVSYIQRHNKIDLNPYDEIFYVKKKDIFLIGQLFLSVKSNKAIRINWVNKDLNNEIHSIDLWNRFKFGKKPNFTLLINKKSIIKFLPDIINFFNRPVEYIEKEVESIDRKLRATPSENEKTELNSDKIKQDDLGIDVFKAIEKYTTQVAKAISNSLIITGTSGVGKTMVVKETLKSLGLTEDVDYFSSTGTITTAGLYEFLFLHRDSLLVFDDCDDVFHDTSSVKILDGALDTYDIRVISKIIKTNAFDSVGMTDNEIQARYDQDTSKLPNRFEFRGQIIFVSNLSENDFDKSLISRSLHVDVNLTREEIIERMKQILRKISPHVSEEKKQEALDYLIYVVEHYPVKFDLNIRTLIHSINIRVGNNEMITIGNRREPIWKPLIRKYLIKT